MSICPSELLLTNFKTPKALMKLFSRFSNVRPAVFDLSEEIKHYQFLLWILQGQHVVDIMIL